MLLKSTNRYASRRFIALAPAVLGPRRDHDDADHMLLWLARTDRVYPAPCLDGHGLLLLSRWSR
jgi:hypothetical protein